MSNPIRNLFVKSSVSEENANSEGHDSILKRTASFVLDSWDCETRRSSLNFILQPDQPIDCPSTMSAETFKWWQQIHETRSSYRIICTGQWALNAVKQISWAHRYSKKQTVRLPRLVENLLLDHETALAKTLDLGCQSKAADVGPIPSSSKRSVSKQHRKTKLPPSKESDTTNTSTTVEPSKNMQWLIKLCSIVCGAEKESKLLREIGCLEHLLFNGPVLSVDHVNLSDLAFYSALDFNDIV